ncbi:hypothetical protein ACIGKR_12305 [Rhodococcus qingshengii]|uniref:hypothetical protein n=1 Tax=Rhodococcus qingshengii TaxID=334542 RepID=UPI0037CB6661
MSVLFTNGNDCGSCTAEMRADHKSVQSGIPRARDKYRDGTNEIDVIRVSKKADWVDIFVQSADGWMWSKRQPLPFPSSFKKVGAA